MAETEAVDHRRHVALAWVAGRQPNSDRVASSETPGLSSRTERKDLTFFFDLTLPSSNVTGVPAPHLFPVGRRPHSSLLLLMPVGEGYTPWTVKTREKWFRRRPAPESG
jgi:hypothetical protein